MRRGQRVPSDVAMAAEGDAAGARPPAPEGLATTSRRILVQGEGAAGMRARVEEGLARAAAIPQDGPHGVGAAVHWSRLGKKFDASPDLEDKECEGALCKK
jgi:hypothetical protein